MTGWEEPLWWLPKVGLAKRCLAWPEAHPNSSQHCWKPHRHRRTRRKEAAARAGDQRTAVIAATICSQSWVGSSHPAKPS